VTGLFQELTGGSLEGSLAHAAMIFAAASKVTPAFHFALVASATVAFFTQEEVDFSSGADTPAEDASALEATSPNLCGRQFVFI